MKDYLTILAAIAFCVATPFTSLTQEDYSIPDDELSAHVINLSLNKGFLIPHYSLMDYYLQNKTLGIRLSIEKILKGGWADSHSYISRGVEIYRTSLGNNEILGHATHIIGFGNAGIHSKGKGRLKFGAGVAILTHKFDLEKNVKNANIGSNANGAIVFEYSIPFRLKKGFALSPHIRFTHYSNGSYKLPNLGLNLLSAGVSLEKTMYNESITSEVAVKSPENHRIQAGLTLGRGQLKNPESKISNNYNVSLHYINSSKTKFLWGTGTDIHFSGTYEAYAHTQETDSYSPTFLNTSRLGVTGLIGLTLGATEIHADVGYYIFDKQKLDGQLYQRLYILTRLGAGFRLKCSLKAHNAKAETFELGITKDLWKK